ncbi:hypothetical protein KGF57_002882 [Candida theae]|uniref:Probable NADPH dehydrogenase n=1 Tax=Candida theae TaxID=1198502 RepID=A0AAD5BF82_9ASCO|nr:uncharacterized protein KGF57_002882 [Candida theae]KAI5958074.1 hypothetical protein KGF57_002882 [Candida theae]
MTDNSNIVKIDALGSTKLFHPIKVGANKLSQRIAHAPTTRLRSTADNVPTDLQLQYYKDRAQAPGTLLITEATYVSEGGIGLPNTPGLWNDTQAKAWKQITDAIREQGSYSSVQLWYLGRTAYPPELKKRGLPFVAPSALYHSEESEKQAKESGHELRALTKDEIEHLINEEFPNAARKALAAGFDYIELHSARGYLLSQFLNPVSNQRTDEYGGSIENRARFLLSIVDKLIPIVGANRIGIRFSPWATFQVSEPEGEEVHSYILKELQKRAEEGNELAYLSYVEPRVSGVVDVKREDINGSNAFVSKIWKGTLIKAGNYTYSAPKFDDLVRDIDNDRTLIAWCRFFTSNPDLVQRLQHGYALQQYDRETFYQQYNWGYNTWNNYNEKKKYDEKTEKERIGKPLA